jgi:putative redox protein
MMPRISGDCNGGSPDVRWDSTRCSWARSFRPRVAFLCRRGPPHSSGLGRIDWPAVPVGGGAGMRPYNATMVQIDLTYEGKLKTRAVHEPSGAVLVTAAPRDNQGDGSSFSPTDLVATALGSCMLTLMGIAARKHEIDLAGTTVRVLKEMSPPPRQIARLTVTIDVVKYVDPERRPALENAALTCPVKRSLGAEVEIPVTFRWKD